LKFVKHGEVFIVGECPDWIRNAIHIEAVDSFEHKLKNAIHKIRMACMDSRISEKFVLMNDDFIFLKPTERIPDYILGPMTRAIADHSTKDGYYYHAFKKTLTLLQEAGFNSPANYEVHYPIVIEKKKFLRMTDSIDWAEHGYLFRSVYGNIFNLGQQKRSDPKIYSVKELDTFKGSDIISTSDRVVLFYQFQKFVEDIFPNPCQYEDRDSAPQKRILYG
jgi:hypothetical protein